MRGTQKIALDNLGFLSYTQTEQAIVCREAQEEKG